MTSPSPRSRYRKKVSDEMLTACIRSLSSAELDAIVGHIWPPADSETAFDSLLEAFVTSQKTWWDTPTLRG